MDYRAWVERAGQFVERIERRNPRVNARFEVGQPATPTQVEELEASVGRRIPEQLRAFFLTATCEWEFGYWWEATTDAQVAASTESFGTRDISGGLESFCELIYTARDYHEGCADVFERVVRVWGQAPCKDPLPIGIVGNGDYLVLDLSCEAPSSPVIYLAHDGESYVLAPDFDTFLESWETICYLDPGLDRPFCQFVDEKGAGLITAETPALVRLRALLSPRD